MPAGKEKAFGVSLWSINAIEKTMNRKKADGHLSKMGPNKLSVHISLFWLLKIREIRILNHYQQSSKLKNYFKKNVMKKNVRNVKME